MSRLQTAERVSAQDQSDNFVFQRSRLAYFYAAEHIRGRVLEIGTGSGYGVEIISPYADEFITVDKFGGERDFSQYPNVKFIEATTPPLPFEAESFDCVISFQVIEHIKKDAEFVAEVCRVLKSGGVFIVSTPNVEMSLTRNPWHVREYTAVEFLALLSGEFKDVTAMGVSGNEKIMEYYNKNREGVERITKWDILRLQYRLPRWMLQIPYDILNRLNRRKLLSDNNSLTLSIEMTDYSVVPTTTNAFDLLYIAKK